MTAENSVLRIWVFKENQRERERESKRQRHKERHRQADRETEKDADIFQIISGQPGTQGQNTAEVGGVRCLELKEPPSLELCWTLPHHQKFYSHTFLS